MDLTIVTSSYNYGQYLREWAESIVACDRRPTRVIIVDNASDDEGRSQAAVAEAYLILQAADIPAEYLLLPERVDLGSARNAAVEKAHSEWVMHLDADDMLMPHALADFESLAPSADVIAAGYERSGNLDEGPRNRTRTYSDTQGQETLDATAPASGVSPFRRSFWERSPYRTDMRGGWDTALWIGFAKLGARFKATRRPVFWYRQHADSIFNTRRLNARASAITGAKLQSLRRGHTGVTVIVPWRATDDAARNRSWDYVRQWYGDHFPDWQLIEATQADGKTWRKGLAIRNALALATGETLIVADADCIIEPEALREAVRLVQSGQAPWVVPHTLVKRLDQQATARFMDGEREPEPQLIRVPYEGFAGGGIFVVGRAEYEATGGIPVGFQGWGAEDETVALIFDTLLGRHKRLGFDLWHLWHEVGPRGRHEMYRANRKLHAQHMELSYDPDALWAFMQSGNFVRSTQAGPRDAGMRLSEMRQEGRNRTLQIRAEQARRNAEANAEREQRNIEDDRLARAGRVGRKRGGQP